MVGPMSTRMFLLWERRAETFIRILEVVSSLFARRALVLRLLPHLADRSCLEVSRVGVRFAFHEIKYDVPRNGARPSTVATRQKSKWKVREIILQGARPSFFVKARPKEPSERP